MGCAMVRGETFGLIQSLERLGVLDGWQSLFIDFIVRTDFSVGLCLRSPIIFIMNSRCCLSRRLYTCLSFTLLALELLNSKL